MKTITIRLSSPLQSYGDEAHFNHRTTGDYPSKSSVIGLLAAALGYGRDDQRIQQLRHLQFAVRVDQSGTIMTEFQTVEWKKNTRKLTYRGLLQDAVFTVALGSEDNALMDQLVWALHHPHFQLYFGRRANVPAGVLQIELFEQRDPVTVLEQLPWQAASWYQKKHRHIASVTVDLIADAGLLSKCLVDYVKDDVKSFSQRKRSFDYRAVVQKRIELPNPLYVKKQQDDIFDYL